MSEAENQPQNDLKTAGIAAKPPHTDLGDVVEVALKADPDLALETSETPKAKSGNTIKMAIDFGAPLAFGLTYFGAEKFGQFADKDMPLLIATGVLVVASTIALIAAYVLEKRVAWMPLIVAVFAIVFGGLTLWLHDTRIIKIKLTVIECFLGAVMLGGLALKKNPLKALIGDSLPLKDEAWGTLTLAYGLFFFAIGIANEFIWRTQTEAIWVTWKSSLFFVTVIFSICMAPYLMKHMKTDDSTKDETEIKS
jgi:intracellular septation protein